VDTKVKSFNDTLRRALRAFMDRPRWETMQKAGMALDFSWPHSARKYLELYKKLVQEAPSLTPGTGQVTLRQG
jgi:glycogen synthase